MRKTKTETNKRKTVRRRAERLHSNLFVHYKKTGKKTPWISVAYKDISGIGIGLLVNQPLPLGEKIDIALYIINDPKPCHIKARVVWCNRIKQGLYKVGLEFIKAESDARLVEMLCEKIVDLSIDRRLT